MRPLNAWQLALFGLALMLLVYGSLVIWLALSGRRSEARALAGFIPDCLILFRRLAADPRMSRWRKAMLAVLLIYLASPIDLVPDFFPVVGQIDDLLLAALAIRVLLRGGGVELLREHWPGPESSLRMVIKLAYW